MSNKRYTPIRVQIRPEQEKRISNAVHCHKGVTIHFSSLNHSSHKNNSILCLTQQQLFKVKKARPGSNFSFPFSAAQVKANVKHEGGFLGILAAALAPIIGGIIGGVAENAIAGSGLKTSKHQDIILHNNQHTLKVTPHGKGLFLSPYTHKANGLFLTPRAMDYFYLHVMVLVLKKLI